MHASGESAGCDSGRNERSTPTSCSHLTLPAPHSPPFDIFSYFLDVDSPILDTFSTFTAPFLPPFWTFSATFHREKRAIDPHLVIAPHVTRHFSPLSRHFQPFPRHFQPLSRHFQPLLTGSNALSTPTTCSHLALQGYLAHKKQPSPLGPPYDPRCSPSVGS